MKKSTLFFILLITSVAFSQNVRFEGTILESGKTPLEMANIMAVNVVSKGMDAYAITNDKGKFVLNLKANTTYAIKLSYIGMQNKEISVTTKSENITQNISMEPGGIELEGVEIVREMPVSIKGDTIVYNADSFKSGTERKLEDVLKKLPGVEVNADGEVEVEGKKVTKLMVEGKDFFDGDTKLGVKNIPADAIDKIQVLRNYNENSILKGVENNQDNVAMNIKLKDGKKNFWFGDMTAGAGNSKRYIVNPKLFYYNPKYSINIISNFNNTGELPLTIQDYFKMTGGFRSFMKKGGSNFNVSSNDLGISMLRNDRAKEIITRFGATNFAYNVTKSWTLSGFGILSSSTTDLETITQSTILVNNTKSTKTELAHQKSDFGLFKLSSSYKPNSKFQFDYDVLNKISRQNEDSNLNREVVYSDNSSSNESILTSKKQNPTSVNQNLGLYYTPNDKHVFVFETQLLFQDENPFYRANLGNNPFPNYVNPADPRNLGIIAEPISGRYDLNQNRNVKTNKLDSKLDYYYMLTPKSNINITLGNTYSYQSFNSNMFQVLSGGGINDMNSNSKNDVKYNFNDAFLGLHYKVLTGKFTFTPGISFHSYTMNNNQSGTDYKTSFTKMLPDFFALYQIKKAETLTYNFSLSNDFTDINQLASGYVLSSYSNLFKGYRGLENATSQVHTLRYFKYNMFNFENIFAVANYTRKIDAVKTDAIFDGVNQSSTPYNSSNFADETLSGMGNYGRSFLKNYKASSSFSVSWNKYYNQQNGLMNISKSIAQNYTFKIATNYKNMPNIELGYNYVINENNNNNRITKIFTQKPSIKVDYYFLKSFSFVSEYEYYKYYTSDKTIQNNYQFLSSSLIYQKTKDSKFEYKIAVTNLLNTRSLNDNSFDQYNTSNSQYTIQPRYFIFSLKYNL